MGGPELEWGKVLHINNKVYKNNMYIVVIFF